MAKEFKLPYTASEINTKLETVDIIKNTLENNHYTSADIDTKIEEINTSLTSKADLDKNGKILASQLPDDIGSDVDLSDYYTKNETDESLSVKADLVDGKVPLSQLPDDIGSSGGLTEVFWKDIKDAPFGATVDYISISENQSITTMDLSEEMGAPVYGNEVMFENPSNKSDWMGECTVVYDETTYNLQNKYDDTTEVTYFGNGSLLNFMGVSLENTGEPFAIVMISGDDNIFVGYMLITNDTQETTHTLSISKLDEVVKTLDPKYIADMYYDTRKIYSFDASVTPNPPSYPIPGFGVNGYKIFDLTPTLDEFFNYKIIRDKNDAGGGSELTFKNQQIMLSGDEMWLIQSDQGYFFGLCRKSGLFEAEYQGIPIVCEVPESGIYYMQDSLSSWTTFDLNLGGELKQIDPKFIPADLDDYYTKNEVYTKSETANVINNNLQYYYTKSQVDTAISNVSVDLSGYYTKTEIDEMIGDIDAVITEINSLIGE